jgi:hypothetical protein
MVLAAGMPALAADAYEVVASGLHSPRGLAFGPGGRLYVGEAGLGSTTGSPSFTSAIVEIRDPGSASPSIRRVVTGLPSIGAPGDVVGVDGVFAFGNGGIYAIVAISREAIGLPDSLFGALLKVTASGQRRAVANVGTVGWEFTGAHPELDPGEQFPDANPYGVLAIPGRVFVVDAGANTLNEVLPDGSVRVLAYFPNTALADATPTCVVQGLDGALYVGTLALVDSIVFGPSAIVYRVDLNDVNPDDLSTTLSVAQPWATGLWPINGCAASPDGNIYVGQMFTHFDMAPSGGDVVKIPQSDPGVHESLADDMLTWTGGVAVGNDGTVYAVNGTIFNDGSVVRLTNR